MQTFENDTNRAEIAMTSSRVNVSHTSVIGIDIVTEFAQNIRFNMHTNLRGSVLLNNCQESSFPSAGQHTSP